MPRDQKQPSSTDVFTPFGPFAPAMEYLMDATQRSVLFWDVMRRRGNQYREHLAQRAPHVLDYQVELVADGRTLERPVNYALVRVIPPAGVELDLTRRPFVIVDPRAGHGPGIGGFKADSEIGVAFKAGHACYFIADGNAQGRSLISRPESRVALLVVPTDEELMIAQHTLALLTQQGTRRIAGESLAT